MNHSLSHWSPQFEWILQMINVGVHIVNRSGQTVFYNEMMAQIDGLERDLVLGKNIFHLFPSLTDESSTLHLALTHGKRSSESIQTYVNMKGKRITAINSTLPLYEGSEIIGAVEIAKDVTKIMDMYDEIVDLRRHLIETNRRKKSSAGTATYCFHDLIGSDPTFRQAVSLAKKATRTQSPVMVCGPTGTGKELIAQSIHNASTRRDYPFIALNCAAVPKDLMEGLLFGTNRGAFTGAVDRPGLFEQADEGTLFLDELNSLDIALQAKLLRVLQEKKIRRVGGGFEQEINVRVIAAMNISTKEALSSGIIRSDLFYRLNVVTVMMPSLIERKSDIPELAEHFIRYFNEMFGMDVKGISAPAVQNLMQYPWPGNVRELEHALEYAFNIIDGGEDMIMEQHLPAYVMQMDKEAASFTSKADRSASQDIDLPKMLEELEREAIITMLDKCQGNVSKTAEALGIRRQALQYKLDKYMIQRVYVQKSAKELSGDET
ncbi:sigma-54 interaction domain-containing protein [Cohnella sp.]|uniref:sigma-54 interaction domain-containing protein n=1 Tax=Cohnella sp. TaxID=1883426 RepID=UPI0035630B46